MRSGLVPRPPRRALLPLAAPLAPVVLLAVLAWRPAAVAAQAPADTVAAQAPGDTVAAEAAGDTVRYTVSVTDPATRLLRVSAEFPTPGDELLVSLPAWTPGSYTIENYARNVRNFSATDPAGRALEWEKGDPDSWRVRAQGAAAARLTFEVLADSLDLDKSKLFEDFGFFNGTNLFLFEEGRTDRPAVLTLELPEGWRAATGLRLATAEGASAAGQGCRFSAATYDELVDAPTFLGRFQLDEFTAGGKPARLAIYPADAFTEEQRGRIRDAVDRILRRQNAVLGAAPYETYTVLVYVGRWGTAFAGGLEHANSHFDILDPAFAESFDQAFPIFQSLLAHETFHLWNVKRIRPAAMWPYDYDEWQPTPLLWFSEGVTDYYADLSVVQADLYTPEQFLAKIEENLTFVAAEPAPIAVEDASLNTWLSPVFGNQYIYYPKGSLIGLLLDLRIRHATGNERSLDTVVRELYADFYSQGRGFTTEDLLGLIGEAGYDDVEAFYESYITGREPLPVGETLALAGLRLERRELTEPFLGLSGGTNPAGEVVIGAVLPGSPAAEAGLRQGDVLLAIGDIPVTADPAWGERFREAYADRDDAPFSLTVRRDGEEMVLAGRMRLRTRVEYDVTRDPDAGELERAIFEDVVEGGEAAP